MSGEPQAQAMKDNRLYEEINVWRRRDSETLVCYRCFRVLPEKRYCVQSADFVGKSESQKSFFNDQFIDLLLEQSPVNRSTLLYDSLEAAIEAHDKEFY